MIRPVRPGDDGPDRVDDRLAEFERFYREHFAAAWRGLLRLGVERSDCEDAAQEVFVAAHRRWDAFDHKVPRRAWLLGIVRRVAWRYRRTDFRRARRHHAFRPDDAPSIAPDDAVLRAEAGRLLSEFLAELDHDRREAFVLGELEELGRVELGGVLGINPNTAYSRLQAARRHFFAHFAALDDDRCATLLASAQHHDDPPRDVRAHGWFVLVPLLGGAAKTVSTGFGGLLAAHAGKLAIGVAAIAIAAVTLAPSDEPSRPPALAVPPIVAATPLPAAIPATPPHVAITSAPPTPTVAPSVAKPRRVGTGADELAAELELLQRARAAMIAGDLDGARRLLTDHDARYAARGELLALRDALVMDLDALVIKRNTGGDSP